MTVDEVARALKTRKDLARALRLNGYFVPSETSSIMTLEYMHKVRKQEYLCPKFDMMNRRHCEFPPTVEDVLKEFLQVTSNIKDTPHTDFGVRPPKYVPDRQWMLDVIGVLVPDHVYFTKTYRPPPREN